jgi:hypothetical protein
VYFERNGVKANINLHCPCLLGLWQKFGLKGTCDSMLKSIYCFVEVKSRSYLCKLGFAVLCLLF